MDSIKKVRFLKLLLEIGFNRWLFFMILTSFCWAWQPFFLKVSSGGDLINAYPSFFLIIRFLCTSIILLTAGYLVLRVFGAQVKIIELFRTIFREKLFVTSFFMGVFMVLARYFEFTSYVNSKYLVEGSIFSIFLVGVWDFKGWIIYRLTYKYKNKIFISTIYRHFAVQLQSIGDLMSWFINTILIIFTTCLFLYGRSGKLPFTQDPGGAILTDIYTCIGWATVSSIFMSFFYDLLVPLSNAAEIPSENNNEKTRKAVLLKKAQEVFNVQVVVSLSALMVSVFLIAILPNERENFGNALTLYLTNDWKWVDFFALFIGYIVGVTVIGYFAEHIFLTLYDVDKQLKYGEFRIKGREWASITATFDPFFGLTIVALLTFKLGYSEDIVYSRLWICVSGLGVVTMILLGFYKLWSKKKEMIRSRAVQSAYLELEDTDMSKASLLNLEWPIRLLFFKGENYQSIVRVKVLGIDETKLSEVIERLIRIKSVGLRFQTIGIQGIGTLTKIWGQESQLFIEKLKMFSRERYGVELLLIQELIEKIHNEKKWLVEVEKNKAINKIAFKEYSDLIEETLVYFTEISLEENEDLAIYIAVYSDGTVIENKTTLYIEDGDYNVRYRDFLELLNDNHRIRMSRLSKSGDYGDLEKGGKAPYLELGNLHFSLSDHNRSNVEFNGKFDNDIVYMKRFDEKLESMLREHIKDRDFNILKNQYKEKEFVIPYVSRESSNNYNRYFWEKSTNYRRKIIYTNSNEDSFGNQIFDQCVISAKLRKYISGEILVVSSPTIEINNLIFEIMLHIYGTNISLTFIDDPEKLQCKVLDYVGTKVIPLVFFAREMELKGRTIVEPINYLAPIFGINNMFMAYDANISDITYYWPKEKVVRAHEGSLTTALEHFFFPYANLNKNVGESTINTFIEDLDKFCNNISQEVESGEIVDLILGRFIEEARI